METGGAGRAGAGTNRKDEGADAVFTTRDLDGRDQFDAYREWMGPLADMYPMAGAAAGFAAAQSIWSFGGLRLVHEVCDPVEGRIASPRLRPSTIDHWVLALHKIGDTTVRSGERVRLTPSGGLCFAALTTDAHLRQDASETLYLFIPRDLCSARAADFDRLHNSNLQGPSAMLLADHLLALERTLSSIDPPAREEVAQGTLGLLRACLPAADSAERHRPERELALRDTAIRFIRRNVEGPLTPAGLCAALGVSRSYLYRLFHDAGGVAGLIRAERLAAARDALADPSDHRRIHRVAADFGFGSAEEFSRAFRRRFACRPSDVYRRTSSAPGSSAEPKGIACLL